MQTIRGEIWSWRPFTFSRRDRHSLLHRTSLHRAADQVIQLHPLPLQYPRSLLCRLTVHMSVHYGLNNNIIFCSIHRREGSTQQVASKSIVYKIIIQNDGRLAGILVETGIQKILLYDRVKIVLVSVVKSRR